MDSYLHGYNREARAAAARIVVVIPCYRARRTISAVLRAVLDHRNGLVFRVYVVDDACPEGSGRLVSENHHDPRIRVLTHKRNLGVGAATKTGYREALADGADILVKLDADGQMKPSQISRLVAPILEGRADYAKGNRFDDLQALSAMPKVRLIGNALLSFISKLTSGYWNLMDPTNGFTAIHERALRRLPLDKIADRYFFETDMLFRLNAIRAVARDVPMPAHYPETRSSLSVSHSLASFPIRLVRNFFKRIAYNYFLRDFNIGSICLLAGSACLGFSAAYGSYHLYRSLFAGVQATSGTVMVASLPILIGFHLLLTFLNQDLHMMPTEPLQQHPRKGIDNERSGVSNYEPGD